MKNKYPNTLVEDLMDALHEHLGLVYDAEEDHNKETMEKFDDIKALEQALKKLEKIQKNTIEFIVDRIKLTPEFSEGKWDEQITVKRLTDGKQLTEKISGGEVLADTVIKRLKNQLRKGK